MSTAGAPAVEGPVAVAPYNFHSPEFFRTELVARNMVSIVVPALTAVESVGSHVVSYNWLWGQATAAPD